jgi:hypothetical protein
LVSLLASTFSWLVSILASVFLWWDHLGCYLFSHAYQTFKISYLSQVFQLRCTVH